MSKIIGLRIKKDGKPGKQGNSDKNTHEKDGKPDNK